MLWLLFSSRTVRRCFFLSRRLFASLASRCCFALAVVEPFLGSSSRVVSSPWLRSPRLHAHFCSRSVVVASSCSLHCLGYQIIFCIRARRTRVRARARLPTRPSTRLAPSDIRSSCILGRQTWIPFRRRRHDCCCDCRRHSRQARMGGTNPPPPPSPRATTAT